jgi:hypothetical protein
MPDAIKIDAGLALVTKFKLQGDSCNGQPRDIRLFCLLYLQLTSGHDEVEVGR